MQGVTNLHYSYTQGHSQRLRDCHGIGVGVSRGDQSLKKQLQRLAAARCVDFIPLFLKPTDPEDIAGASAVLDSLRTLDVQCRVFKRNADDFGTPLFFPCLRSYSAAHQVTKHLLGFQLVFVGGVLHSSCACP